MSAWEETMRTLLGKHVEVTYSEEPKATQVGVLHQFGDDGSVCIRDECGFLHWCWPNLKVREVS